jgi:hypothetical protein
MRIRVKATARVMGLKAGDVAEVETSPYVDTLVNHGWLIWLDRPVDAPIVTPPPASERKNISTKGRGTKPIVLESPGEPEEQDPYDRPGALYDEPDES